MCGRESAQPQHVRPSSTMGPWLQQTRQWNSSSWSCEHVEQCWTMRTFSWSCSEEKHWANGTIKGRSGARTSVIHLLACQETEHIHDLYSYQMQRLNPQSIHFNSSGPFVFKLNMLLTLQPRITSLVMRQVTFDPVVDSSTTLPQRKLLPEGVAAGLDYYSQTLSVTVSHLHRKLHHM